MTVREFLLRVRKQNHMLLVYEQELTNLQAHASNISSPAFGDKVQGNHISSLDEIVEKIVMQADKADLDALGFVAVLGLAAAGAQCEHHDEREQKGYNFLHFVTSFT